MAGRPRVSEARAALEAAARSRLARPGERFLTGREVALKHGVCYQTAHRLLAELADEGLLERRGRSGTFIAGGPRKPRRLALCFNARAQNPHGFGGKLAAVLQQALEREGLSCRSGFSDTVAPQQDELPILWERPDLAERCAAEHRSAIVLNDRAPAGWGSDAIDSIGIDDFAGGALAADVLERSNPGGRRVVLAGPAGDRRSDERIAGFRSRKRTTVVHADNWYRDAGRRAGPKVLRCKPAAVFAANDRLAQGFLLACRDEGIEAPPLVGYDDAPIAARLGLTTIALPWEEMARSVVARARLRLRAEATAAWTLILPPHAVLRKTTPYLRRQMAKAERS